MVLSTHIHVQTSTPQVHTTNDRPGMRPGSDMCTRDHVTIGPECDWAEFHTTRPTQSATGPSFTHPPTGSDALAGGTHPMGLMCRCTRCARGACKHPAAKRARERAGLASTRRRSKRGAGEHPAAKRARGWRAPGGMVV